MAKTEKTVAVAAVGLSAALAQLTALDAENTKIVVDEIEALKAEVKTYETELAALRAKLDVQAAEKATGKPVIEHEGKKYAVNVPDFQFKGVHYNVEKLKQEPDLVSALIKRGTSVLTLID